MDNFVARVRFAGRPMGGEQMVSSLERFQAMIENSSDAISLVDAEGQVLYANGSTANVLGYQPEELLGRNGLELLHPEDREYSVQTLKKLLADPLWPNRMQARVRQKDGQWRWVESTATNLLDEPCVGAIVINFREIGTRRAEEEERQHLAEELARSKAELRAFALTAAHDLREPLRTISALTQVLVRKAQLDEAGKEIADFIVAGVQRMNTLLDCLLSSATRDSDDSLRPVELEHAAAQAIQNLREALTSSGATIMIEALPIVQGKESDLVRLFQNIISNAVKFRSEAPVEVLITAERFGSHWVIRLRDNGVGIPKAHQQLIFGRFTRLHSTEIPGAGLGLAFCKKIVEAAGGTIWVESEPGAGSTFCFTVAAAQEKSGTIAGDGVCQ